MWWLLGRLSMTRTQPGTGEKCQAAKSLKFDLYQVLRWKVSLNQTDSKPFLRAKQKPKTNRRWVKLASKRSVSVYCGFPCRWLLWVVTGSSPSRRKKTKNAWSQVRKKKTSAQRRLDMARKASWSQNSKLPHLQLTADKERSLEELSKVGKYKRL